MKRRKPFQGADLPPLSKPSIGSRQVSDLEGLDSHQEDSGVVIETSHRSASSETRPRTRDEYIPLELAPSENRDPHELLSPSVPHSMAQSPPVTLQLQEIPRYSAADIVDTNSYTKNLEFYGASSSTAFLKHVEKISGSHVSDSGNGKSEGSLASLLHNTNFRPYSTPSTLTDHTQGTNDRFYFRVARRFIEAYFSNIHCVQPIFDEEIFLARCEDLWFDKPEKQPLVFIALYYITLSLGSLVMIWDEREIYGQDRFAWSRKFYNEAVVIVTQLGSETDLEMVQCYYLIVSRMIGLCSQKGNPYHIFRERFVNMS